MIVGARPEPMKPNLLLRPGGTPRTRARPDPSEIRLSSNFEVRYWMQALGVSRAALEFAVRTVGTDVEAVRRLLRQASKNQP